MNYRHTEILATQNLGDSGTKPIDIDITDPISMITVLHQPAGGSASPVAHPVANIEQIEIVDGSDKMYSLSGYEGQALNIFEAKRPQIQEIDFRIGGVSQVVVHLMFGRKLWDPELALNPKKHGNLQLKIKWNEANFDASCTSSSFTVFGHVFDEKVVTPVGFLMSKNVKTYTPSSGSWEYTNLPTDHPIRKVILKGLKYKIDLRGIIEDFKLDEDNDKRVLIDGDVHQLQHALNIMAGDCVDRVIGIAMIAADYWPCTANKYAASVGCPDSKAAYFGTGQWTGGSFMAQASADDTVFNAIVFGHNPHGCICIPFGEQDDLADWWNTSELKKARLSIKGGTSSASGDEVGVVTQQLRRYPV